MFRFCERASLEESVIGPVLHRKLDHTCDGNRPVVLRETYNIRSWIRGHARLSSIFGEVKADIFFGYS